MPRTTRQKHKAKAKTQEKRSARRKTRKERILSGEEKPLPPQLCITVKEAAFLAERLGNDFLPAEGNRLLKKLRDFLELTDLEA